MAGFDLRRFESIQRQLNEHRLFLKKVDSVLRRNLTATNKVGKLNEIACELEDEIARIKASA